MRITLFNPCLVNQAFPETTKATIQVLERLGHTVVVPHDQTCCGQALFNSGFRKEAFQLAQRFMRVFGDAEIIVAPSGSCVGMVTNHYKELFDSHEDIHVINGSKDNTLAEWYGLRSRVHELSSFLVDYLGVEDVGASFHHKVSYHASCHALRDLKIDEQPLRLLKAVDGLELIEGEWGDECCGFGGAFSVKYKELSQIIADRRANALSNGGAEYITGVDDSCLHNLNQSFIRNKKPQRSLHIATILSSIK